MVIVFDKLLTKGLAERSNLRNLLGISGVNEMKDISRQILFFAAKAGNYLLKLT